MSERKLIDKYSIICTFKNHPNCPKCGSFNTKIKQSNHTDYIHRPMQYPLCNDCGYSGMINFESIYWGGCIICGIFCKTKEEALKAIELCQKEK